MRIEMSRTFPVPRTTGFDFATDLAHWPDYLDVRFPEGKKQSWAKKGDEIEFTWRAVGVPMPGTGKIEEIVPGEHVHAVFVVKPFPETTYDLRFENAGAHAFTLRVTVSAPEPKGLFGRSKQLVLMFGPILKRDVTRMLDRLGVSFMAMHDKKESVAA